MRNADPARPAALALTPTSTNTGWRDLARLSEPELAAEDIAKLHLACAVDLAGSEDLDISACLRTLDDYSTLVAAKTRRLAPHFDRNPASFRHSRAYFRALVLLTVLQRDLGLRGTDAFNGRPDCSDSRRIFLHGVLNGVPGTCSTLPVVTVAVGRRLGYPMFLVRTAHHLYCRWDDPSGERFNIEYGLTGASTPSDEDYFNWPTKVTPAQAAEGDWFRSDPPRADLANFVTMRGFCLVWTKRYPEALEAFAASVALNPRNRSMLDPIGKMLNMWRDALFGILPPARPRLTVIRPPRRYPHLPDAMQERIFFLEGWQAFLFQASSAATLSPTFALESGPYGIDHVTVTYPLPDGGGR